MAQGKGVDLLCGFRTAATWGTSVAVGTSDKGFRVLSLSWEDNIEDIEDASYNADLMMRQSDLVGRYKWTGTFDVDLKYEGLDILLAQFMGTAGTPTGAGPYVHTWYRKNNKTGVFGTFCWYDGIKTHEVDSAKISAVKLVFEAGRVVRATFTMLGRRRQENTGTNANLTSLTEPSTINRVQALASLVSCQIITQGGTLADFEANKVEIDLECPYEDDDRIYTTLSAPYMREPMATGFSVKGNVTIPYEATTYLAGRLAGTAYELKVLHTLSATQILGVWLPHLKFIGGAPQLQDKGSMPLPLNFRSDKALSAPTGFDQAVAYIKVTNNRSTDALAA